MPSSVQLFGCISADFLALISRFQNHCYVKLSKLNDYVFDNAVFCNYGE